MAILQQCFFDPGVWMLRKLIMVCAINKARFSLLGQMRNVARVLAWRRFIYKGKMSHYSLYYESSIQKPNEIGKEQKSRRKLLYLGSLEWDFLQRLGCSPGFRYSNIQFQLGTRYQFIPIPRKRRSSLDAQTRILHCRNWEYSELFGLWTALSLRSYFWNCNSVRIKLAIPDFFHTSPKSVSNTFGAYAHYLWQLSTTYIKTAALGSFRLWLLPQLLKDQYLGISVDGFYRMTRIRSGVSRILAPDLFWTHISKLNWYLVKGKGLGGEFLRSKRTLEFCWTGAWLAYTILALIFRGR